MSVVRVIVLISTPTNRREIEMGYYKNLEIENQVEVADRFRRNRRTTHQPIRHLMVPRWVLTTLTAVSIAQSVAIIALVIFL
jgi:hypothetical protein